MHRRVGRHLRHNVVAYIALFFAMGGTGAYAANEWTGANIKNETLTGADVRGKAATSSTRLVEGTITGQDIRGSAAVNGSILGHDIANNSVTGSDISEPSLSRVPNADRLDGQDSSAFTTRWALVDGTPGTIARQSGGISIRRFGAGRYFLNFGSSVANHGLQATLSGDARGDLKIGEIEIFPCDGERANCPDYIVGENQDGSWALVRTTDSEGTTTPDGTPYVDQDFYVAAHP